MVLQDGRGSRLGGKRERARQGGRERERSREIERELACLVYVPYVPRVVGYAEEKEGPFVIERQNNGRQSGNLSTQGEIIKKKNFKK